MRQEAVTVIRLDIGDVPPKAAAVSSAFTRMGAAGDTSARQIQAAMRSLPAQFTDVATQLAGGANPMLVLLQQGGQVRDQFGSLGAAFVGVRAAISPMVLGMGALAAAVGAASLAAIQSYQEAARLEKALALNGYAAGVTRGQIEALAKTMAAARGGAVADYAAALGELAAAGVFLGGNLELAGRATVALQKLSGQSAEQIAGDLGRMRNGVAAWALVANRSYNFLTVEQYKLIRAFEAQGKSQEAAKVALEALAGAAESRVVPAMSTLERMLEAGAKLWKNWWAAAKGVMGAETVESEMQRLQEQLAKLRLGGVPGDKYFGADGRQVAGRQAAIDSFESRLEVLNREAFRDSERAQAKAAKAAKEQQAIEAEQLSGARLAVQQAEYAKEMALLQQNGESSRRELDRQFSKNLISRRQFNEEVIKLEMRRSDDELAVAQNAIDMEKAKRPGTPAERLAQTRAIIDAETKLIDVQGRRAKLMDEIAADKFYPEAREVKEDPYAALRQSEKGADPQANSALWWAVAEAAAQRKAALVELTDATKRANLDLIADDRTRGEAQIALDREILQRRIELIFGSSADRAAAEAQADAQAAAQRQALAQRTALVTREETRDALAAAFRDASGRPLQAFGNAIGNIVYQRMTTSVADSLVNALFGNGRPGSDGGLIGAALGSATGGLFGGLFGGQRANGGDVRAGRFYEVNEASGPGELLRTRSGRTYLMARQDGAVMPATGSAAGGGVTVVQQLTFNSGTNNRAELAVWAGQIKRETLAAVAEQKRRGFTA